MLYIINNTDNNKNRYASKEMLLVWSPATKFSNWRKLWVALAEAERQLGLKEITKERLEEMSNELWNIDMEVALAKEREFCHDVMGHVHAYGQVAPLAMPILHLGATSCYVGDNCDIL